MLLGLLVLALARPCGRLWRQAGGQHADRIPLRVMDTPALPLLVRRTPLVKPRREIKGLARRRGYRKSRWGDPEDHIGLLAHRRGHTAPVPIAVVGHRDIARLQREVGETFGAVLIGHHALVHAAGGEVVGAMHPPVVAGPARMPETRGID